MTNNYTKGFTLIETLAAVLLLSIAIVGPLTIAQKGLTTALISKDQNTAFNLAQDAVEYIRYARDSNCLTAATGGCAAATWLTGSIVNLTPCLNTSVAGTNACTVDSYANAVASCTGGVCGAINFDGPPTDLTASALNAYTYTSGANIVASIFTRTVQIVTPSACSTASNTTPCEADITVTVSWSDPLQHSIVVKESLYDWE